MLLGYIREDDGSQHRRLLAAGCKVVAEDLQYILKRLAPDDTLVVTSLDRLDLTAVEFFALLEEIMARKRADFRSLEERLDTAGPFREYMVSLLSAAKRAQVVIKNERRRRGILKAAGKQTGRPRKMTKQKFLRAQKMVDAGRATASDVIAMLGVSRYTYYYWRKRYARDEE